MIITIDGPVASGKSTIAKKLSQKLNFFYINSGLLYRAVAYACINFYKLDLQELPYVDFSLIKDSIKTRQLRYEWTKHFSVHIYFQNLEITDFLFDSNIGQAAASIALNSEVRSLLVNYQRKLSEKKSIVADGRDCGTVVFTKAQFKFFILASESVRALRLLKREKNRNSFDKCLEIVKKRDEFDYKRNISQLKPAADAIIIDNSYLSVKETIDVILKYVKN